jgi:2-succinyl-5-enolpyruvyl-6-hydroxy-3-cyclohexene-1-carboxylate synthase
VTIQSTFCATLVDEFVRSGVRHAVVSPGSRSSPLAIALLANADIEVHVRLDERSACFFALGLGLESGVPALMVTTSGTASAELHAGVVEADLAGVPLIVCTADRPPELHGVGAPQTIDQTHLYGKSARYFVDFGVPDESTRSLWRSLASRLVLEATSSPLGPGPVHANLPFREPLAGPVDDLPEPSADQRAWHHASRARGSDEVTLERFLLALQGSKRGVFVVGAGAFERDPRSLISLADALGWPILTDARGIAREPFDAVIVHSDGILRSALATTELVPDLVCHFGSPHAGRVMESWLAKLSDQGVRQLLVDPFGRLEDPSRAQGEVIGADPVALVTQTLESLAHQSPGRDYLDSWRRADDAADAAIEATLGVTPGLSEPWIARRLVELAPATSTLFASSSMPIRDLEWFSPRRHGAPRLLANRGANGIDGVTSTMLGVAASASEFGAPPVLGIIGDLAFLHDLSGLVWGSLESCPGATLVLVDNAGGGIFNFLAYPDLLDDATFERGFGTPQSVDLAAVIAAFGIPIAKVENAADFDAAVLAGIDQATLSIVLCTTERRSNVALHAELNAAIVAAVEATGDSR